MEITTLIPAYKPKYINELINSILTQSVLPCRVIFSDDSPNRVFKEYLNSEPVRSMISTLNVEVIDGPRLGGNANFCHVLKYFNKGTGLVHILCDDDIVYPCFYERHLNAHNNGEFSTSISRRWTSNESGHPSGHALPIPDIIKYHPNRNLSIDSKYVFETTIGSARNWLGEFSNAVYRSEFAEYIIAREIAGISYAGLEDLGSFVQGSLSLPICFINEHLGFWRRSTEQFSSQQYGPALKLAFLAYISLSIAGRKLGQVSHLMSQKTISLVAANIAHHYGNEADMACFCGLMPGLINNSPGAEEAFLQCWKECKIFH
ncbi:MAG: glycosyltransferase family 2 protein [Planctomycetes bacterium]|nr:glycosyltransferase family 2 protein [Planctomycetota bacterium]